MALKVLVADDEKGTVEAIEDRLVVYGFNVVTASSGEQALQHLAREKFDGVFLDVRMPGLDGIQVLERIRETDTKLPVIMIASSSSSEVAARAIDLGANGYVLKPFEWEELKAKIEEVYGILL